MAAFIPGGAVGVCEVFDSPLHANGVRALRPVAGGEPIFEERPLAFLQTIENRQCNAICASCHGFLGGLDLQSGLLTRRVSRQDQQSIAQNGGIVMCCNQCGELYCSEQCRVEHWHNRGHRLLCTGHLDTTDPLVQFKIHAVQTNEIFLLVADIYAVTVDSIERKLEQSVPLEEAVTTSLMPFGGYVRQLWWDAAVAPPGTDPDHLRSTLQALVSESWGLLNPALRLSERGLDAWLGPEYMARLIGMFEQNNVGVRGSSPLATLCSMVSQGSPEATWLAETAEAVAQKMEEEGWEDCGSEDCQSDHGEGEGEGECEADGGDEEEEEGGDEAVMDTASERWSPDNAGSDENMQRLYAVLSREGIDAVFPPLDGTAFYSLVCKINHSCEPNVRVCYPQAEPGAPPRPLAAQLVALRDLVAGEELLQSYIDQDASWDQRRVALLDYGFECNCRKCRMHE